MNSEEPTADIGGSSDDDHRIWERQSLQRHVVRRRADGFSETVLLVDGLRCSNCVQQVERSLTALPAVRKVQINPASRRARVVWDDQLATLTTLLNVVTQAGFKPLPIDARALDNSRRDESRDMQKRLLVAGFGAMQAMMYASALYVGAINPIDSATRELFRWLGFLIATPVVLYSARPFFVGAMRSLRGRRFGMDVPVALAVSLVYGASLAAAAGGGGEIYFDSVSMFVFFLLAGRYLEMRGRHKALDLSDGLARLMPTFAQRRGDDGTLKKVPVIELQPGDRIHVDSGDVVPADGKVQNLSCRIDESMLTGESIPRLRRYGESVNAGSMVAEGPLEFVVDRTGVDTTLAGIVALVSRAQAERPRLARAGERTVGYFVTMVLTMATATALFWGIVNPDRAFAAVVAVLVVSCPCAFALAVPAAITRTLAVLAGSGVLVVRADAIETLAAATHVVFDKTGTLTDGLAMNGIKLTSSPGRADWRDTAWITGDRLAQSLGKKESGPDTRAVWEAARLAAALARESRHPASRAIAAAVADDMPLRAQNVRSYSGLGLEGWVEGRKLRLGRMEFALPDSTHPNLHEGVVLADETGVLAEFDIGEKLRSGARNAIAALEAQGLSVLIASGDAPARVERIARQLNIEQWHGGLLPEDKLALLRRLRAEGGRIVAVGDGVNDAPVLAGADVAVAMSEGSDLTHAASDIVLTGDRLNVIAESRKLAQETLAVVQQNQRWALLYNLAAIPLAACGFVPPWLAAIGMSASSLGVVLNALRIGWPRRPSRHINSTPRPIPV